MQKTQCTFDELLQASYQALVAKGKAPVYQSDERDSFDCSINGMSFVFHSMDDDLFAFHVEFKIAQPISEEMKERLAQTFHTEELPFENLHIYEDLAVLSSAFFCDMFTKEEMDGLMQEVIDALERANGIVSLLREHQASDI